MQIQENLINADPDPLVESGKSEVGAKFKKVPMAFSSSTFWPSSCVMLIIIVLVLSSSFWAKNNVQSILLLPV
jgi:hypothetical protein